MDTTPSFPRRKLHRLDMTVYATTEFEFSFTVCARHQGEPFLTTTLAESVIDALLWTRTEYKWLLFCYCLMPDHLHFVCRLTENYVRLVKTGAHGLQPEGVLDHLARLKSYATRQSWKHGFHGRLWQKSSFDRVLDLERPFEEVVRYTLENPQRKGLVNDWQDWPYARIVDPWWV